MHTTLGLLASGQLKSHTKRCLESEINAIDHT